MDGFFQIYLGLLLFSVSVVGLFYLYVTWAFRYFKRRNIPFERPVFPFGSFAKGVFQKSSMPDMLGEIYNRMGNNPLLGYFVFWRPAVLIKDLELIKHILVKDFSTFYDRGMYHDENIDPLSAHLFAMEGEKWKKMRVKLSPVFTAGKMKTMFPIVKQSGNNLQQYVEKITQDNDVLECRELLSRYGMQVIASTAFGLETNTFIPGYNEFMDMAGKFLASSFAVVIRSFLAFHLQSLARYLKYKVTPAESSAFFLKVVKDAVEYREKNNVSRGDFLQMLIQLKNRGAIDDGSGPVSDPLFITMDEMTAQSYVFILAGYETSSLTNTFALYELALNPDIQKRLQEEIDEVEGEMTYENLHQMEYLDMVINETLRKYPVLSFLMRKCGQDYKVPNTNIVLEKGTDINISVMGLHRDPELFPEPDKFNPERFCKEPVHEIKPYSYLPFGDGPRFCIGMRFGKMQTKLGLVMLLKQFTVDVSDKTPIPLVLDPRAILTNSKGGMWLKFKKRL